MNIFFFLDELFELITTSKGQKVPPNKATTLTPKKAPPAQELELKPKQQQQPASQKVRTQCFFFDSLYSVVESKPSQAWKIRGGSCTCKNRNPTSGYVVDR